MFNLLNSYIDKEINILLNKKIKIKILGNIKPFPKKLKSKIIKVEKLTKNNDKIQINMALNYGSKQEIIRAVNILNKKKLKINSNNIKNNLYTKNIPDPEILIRTGDTNRISNFLLWQSIYSEIFFEKKMWPDFTKNDFFRILKKFNNVNRNFGGLNVRNQ